MTATAPRTSSNIVSTCTRRILPDGPARARAGGAGRCQPGWAAAAAATAAVDVRLGPVPVDAEPGEHAGAVLGLEQGQQDVLGADVVVAQPQRLAERQLEGLLRLGVERDERRDVAARPAAAWRRRSGAPCRPATPWAVDRLRAEALGLAEQAQDQVAGRDRGVARGPGLLLGGDDDVARARA